MDPLLVAAFIILLILSGFFSSSETALFALDTLKVEALTKTNDPRAKILKELKKDVQNTLITILIWNNFVNVLASALATYIAIQIFGSLGVSIATGVVTFLILIAGEITPKYIGASIPLSFALFCALPLHYLKIITRPGTMFFSSIAKIVARALNIEEEPASLTESEIKEAIKIGEREGVIEERERDMIEKILELDEKTAEDIMVPRMEVTMFDGDKTLGDVWGTIVETGHSRFPVYLGNRDNIIGILYAKALLSQKLEKDKKVKDLIVPTFFVPVSKKLSSLLREFQRRKTQLAIVVDEYGGLEGIVTLEDLLEEIVGEIEDESDVEEEKIKPVGEGEYIIDATTEIGEVNETLGTSLSDSEYYSLGGVVIHNMDRIPKIGEELEIDDLRIKVLDSNQKRIKKLLVKVKREKSMRERKEKGGRSIIKGKKKEDGKEGKREKKERKGQRARRKIKKSKTHSP